VTAFPAGDTAPAATLTPTLAPTPTVGPDPEPAVTAKTRTRTRRRWHRVVIPFAVLVLAWAWTLAAHSLQSPSLRDPGTMSPAGTGPDGSSVLADRLRERGVTILPARSTAQAVDLLQTIDARPATVFVPAPDFLNGSLVDRVAALGLNLRIVMVRPGIFARAAAGSPFFGSQTRWASRALPPGCDSPVATGAGVATAHHDAYESFEDVAPFSSVTMDCYQGGLVAARVRGLEIVYVGATDPFRNSRIGEGGNAALATGLLSTSDRLIWLDVHSQELAVGHIDLTLPQYHRGGQDRTTSQGDPTLEAFPPIMWAALLLVALGAVLFALARARRLGPPVAEPLPVVVPAAEAITGRGRLYRRVHARQATLDALRAAAIARLARLVYQFDEAPPERDLLAPGPAADALVARVADRTGDPNAIRSVLYGLTVDSDEDLAAAVASLDAIVATVLRHNPSAAPPRIEQESP
jgi:hypothetical protein